MLGTLEENRQEFPMITLEFTSDSSCLKLPAHVKKAENTINQSVGRLAAFFFRVDINQRLSGVKVERRHHPVASTIYAIDNPRIRMLLSVERACPQSKSYTMRCRSLLKGMKE